MRLNNSFRLKFFFKTFSLNKGSSTFNSTNLAGAKILKAGSSSILIIDSEGSSLTLSIERF
jgi:hypothetical protein